MADRQFPVHATHQYILRSIPWSLIESRRHRALDNHDQTLEKLAERGGLDLFEIAALIADRDVGYVLTLKNEIAVAIVFEALMAHERTLTTRRGKAFVEWGKETFGQVAIFLGERALRFVEEALELGHVCGVSQEKLLLLIKRIYSRPLGTIEQEAGQALLTLEGLAYAAKVDLVAEGAKEWERVRTIPKAEWQTRYERKKADGVTE